MKKSIFSTHWLGLTKPFLSTLMIVSFSFLFTNYGLKEEPTAIKSRFYTVILDSANGDFYRDKPEFSHFTFQCQNSAKDGVFGRRRVFVLIAYAIDKTGEKMHNDPIVLKPVLGKPFEKEYSDRDEFINLSNYEMDRKQYDFLRGPRDATVFKGLIFYPMKEDPSKKDKNGKQVTFPNYVTYEVYRYYGKPIPKTNDLLERDQYLKPSPPAPPRP